MPLTSEQQLHNRLLDLEIEQAEREFQNRETIARLRQEAWDKEHPEGAWITTESGEKINLQSKMFMNMTGRKKVIGIRYVE